MDHQPPPFFKRGPAPLARLTFYAALSLALIFVDSRFQTLELLRQGLSLFTHPIQQAAHAPVEALQNVGSYFSAISRFQDENARLKRAQVTRVFPFVSEITLITDKEQAVPVQVVRNGLRSVVFGLGNGQLELRFMPANADVQIGDLLVTSGLDGIWLPGLPVAKVVSIERDTSYSFARIYCVPVAGVENFGEVMVLDPRETIPLPAQLNSEAADIGAKSSAKSGAKKKRLQKE